MKAPPTPSDESARLASLVALNILDTPIEERFERIARMAMRTFNVPIAAISLIDAKRQWFKAIHGLTANETPREVSFCGHAILGDAPMVVPDARSDPRFADNPLVADDPNMRFYAGCPVRGPDGAKLGTLCIIDRAPRSIAQQDIETLQDLAHMVEDELRTQSVNARHAALLTELDAVRRKAAVDGLTGLWTRATIDELLLREYVQARHDGTALAVAFIDFDYFKKVNDTYGHAAGDTVLREGATRLNAALRAMDSLGRYGGEELVAIIPRCSLDDLATIGERLRQVMAASPIETAAGPVSVSISIGLAQSPAHASATVEQLTAAADAALYRAKAGGRNRVELVELL